MPISNFQPFKLLDPGCWYKFTYWMTNSPDPATKFQITNNFKFFLANIAEHENFSANKYENANYCWHFHIYWQRNFQAQLSWAWKKFYNLGASITETVGSVTRLYSTACSISDCRFRGHKFESGQLIQCFHGSLSWNHFCGLSLPCANSRRAVVFKN